MTSIEINATFYGSQKPASFEKWRDATPAGFVFAVKGPRGAGQHKEAEAVRASIARFLNSGVTLLARKLGPILWQFPPTRQFDAGLVAMFLAELPREHDGAALRHAIEARHASFARPAYLDLLRTANVAHVIVDSGKQTLLGDVTADFVYCRLQRNTLAEPEGYAAAGLDAWAARAKAWSAGKAVADLPLAGTAKTRNQPRDCFLYCISGDKVRAPDAARALIGRLS